MRTTVTLDDDVLALIEEERRESGDSFRVTINRMLRRSVHKPTDAPAPELPVFPVAPAFDISDVSAVLADLEEEDFLRKADPPADAVVDYGDRDEHCWNGDPTRSNAYSQLRYHQMFIPRFVERALKTAPAGADVTSWRY